MSQDFPQPSLREVAHVFLKLGMTSSGGPAAHLGYLHEEIVQRRRWLPEEDYADLVALCQFLPGPASSQVVFGLGQRRAGIFGALVASLCFTLPSALLMIGFGYGISAAAGLREAGWLHGLKLAAVAVVAQAVWIMGRKLCPDWPRLVVGLLAALGVVFFPSAAVQIGVIVAGAITGWLFYRKDQQKRISAGGVIFARDHLWAALTLALFVLLLVALPILVAASGNRNLAIFDSFYRAGALVFGGGHVVLPLLRAEVVPAGWISDDRFLAGYGLAQAVPGPLFTFAAYLGTVIKGGSAAWIGGIWCLFAIFLPAWLLIGGSLPFWNLLRSKAGVQTALRGANAAVVGVLLAALYNPVWKQGVTGFRDAIIALAAFAALEVWRFPAWSVVLLTAAASHWLL